MTLPIEHHTKPWLLWYHDPCPEGGWHIGGSFDTQEEAIAMAKLRHEEEVKRHWEMVEYIKKKESEGRPDREWLWEDNCYEGAIVTPNYVFKIDEPPPGAALRKERGP